MTQASAAASMAMELLAPARNTLITKKSYPDEHDVTDEEPRIGVFVCHCGMNIGSVVDVEQVVKNIEHEPGVVLATHTMFTCSDTSLSNIKEHDSASTGSTASWWPPARRGRTSRCSARRCAKRG